MKVKRTILIISLLMFFLPGCVTLTTFQGPETNKPGKFSAGIGFSRTLGKKIEESNDISYEVFARLGLAERVDCGLKIGGLFSTVSGDVKFQFLEGKKFNGSLDMAVSLFSVEWGINDTTDHKNSVLGLYPSLILGTKDIYFGPKLVYLIGTGDVGDYIDTQHRLPYKKPFLGFFTGLKLKLGKKLRLIPEVTLYYTPDYGVWFHGGIALSSD